MPKDVDEVLIVVGETGSGKTTQMRFENEQHGYPTSEI